MGINRESGGVSHLLCLAQPCRGKRTHRSGSQGQQLGGGHKPERCKVRCTTQATEWAKVCKQSDTVGVQIHCANHSQVGTNTLRKPSAGPGTQSAEQQGACGVVDGPYKSQLHQHSTRLLPP